MIRKWEVFSNFSCSPEITSSLHTEDFNSFSLAFLHWPFRKAHPISERGSSAGPGQTQWQSDTGFGKEKYTFISWKRRNTHWNIHIYNTQPLSTQPRDLFWFLPQSLPLGLFNSVNTTPGTPRCSWNCYLLRSLFRNCYLLPGRTTLSRMQPSRALCSPLQWLMCAHGPRAAVQWELGKEQGWTPGSCLSISLRALVLTGVLSTEMSPSTPPTPATVSKNCSMQCLSKWACHSH